MQLLGRLHPLILHLPIGILLLVWLMEWLGQKDKYAFLRPAVGFGLKVGIWSALAAALSGLLLSYEGGYEENVLFWHQWLGIGTAIFSVAIYFLYQKKEQYSKIWFPAFSALILLLLVTGHYGGSLTHGSDFLLEPFSAAEEAHKITKLEEAVVFSDFIQPIFKKKCVSCHNKSKLKGELLLSTIEGIQAGGESGPLFDTKEVKNSLILKRIHLPLEEKKHMPPKGKPQLNEDEIALLEWWIAANAPFEQKVAAVEKPEAIEQILQKYVQPEDEGVLGLKVKPAKDKHLMALQDIGAKVYPLAQESPFLSVNFSGQQGLTTKQLNQLKTIKEQLVHLDLSQSELKDEDLAIVKDLPHLQKLYIQQTDISNEGLVHLKDLQYLEYLNAYATKIDDEGLSTIAHLPRLKKLFLWQTVVTDTAIATIQQARPHLEISIGNHDHIFGNAQLSPPLIIAERDIFKDSLEVSLEVNFQGVDLFYTLDGNLPDSTSARYVDPIVLTQTTDLKVIAARAGWETSPIASQFFVRAKYQPKNIRLNRPPSEKYAADGSKSLGDFKKGTTAFIDGNWLGYEKQHFSATLDFGKVVEISRVTVSALEDTGSWIFFPKGLEIALSKDGNNFKKIATESYPTTNGPKPGKLQNFSLAFDTAKARYVQVKVKSNLTNPAWHPGAGQPCWVFVDEILVE